MFFYLKVDGTPSPHSKILSLQNINCEIVIRSLTIIIIVHYLIHDLDPIGMIGVFLYIPIIFRYYMR